MLEALDHRLALLDREEAEVRAMPRKIEDPSEPSIRTGARRESFLPYRIEDPVRAIHRAAAVSCSHPHRGAAGTRARRIAS